MMVQWCLSCVLRALHINTVSTNQSASLGEEIHLILPRFRTNKKKKKKQRDKAPVSLFGWIRDMYRRIVFFESR